MSEILTVILDVSGSFAENGKIEILRAARLGVEFFVEKFAADAEFFVWREEIRPFTEPGDLVAEGRANVEALIKFVSDREAGSRFLILSDGGWTSSEAASIKRALKKKRSHSAFVAIGADAASSKNYSISTVGGIWSAIDLGAAIGTLAGASQ